mmetsp:Transcript_18986/g.32471  ORF Transcript_18986/g.32471 Transcript_18986/m.32471 type:complete len:345 (-) Transcript_18986:94-1128(-)
MSISSAPCRASSSVSGTTVATPAASTLPLATGPGCFPVAVAAPVVDGTCSPGPCCSLSLFIRSNNSVSLLSKRARSTSHSRIASMTVSSPPTTSCSTCKIWQPGGIPGSSWCDRARSNVVFPVPLRPTRPYRRPNASMRLASSISSFPPFETLKLSRCRSRAPPPPLLFRTIVGMLPFTAASALDWWASNSERAATSSFALILSMRALSLSVMVGRHPSFTSPKGVCIIFLPLFSSMISNALLSASESSTGPRSRARMVLAVALPEYCSASCRQTMRASSSLEQQPPSTKNGPSWSKHSSPSSPKLKCSSSKRPHMYSTMSGSPFPSTRPSSVAFTSRAMSRSC